jgi:nucleoside 2-deoxyribosyltransferase
MSVTGSPETASNHPPIVYLAGPEVFLPNAEEIASAKKRVCRAHGFEGRFPTDEPQSSSEPPGEDGLAIFGQCIDNLEESQLIIANMTPFRGPSMDVGTAVEIGFMYAKRRPVFGYTNVTEDYAARVTPDGMRVEAFGFADNLMCEGPLLRSGAGVVRTRVDPSERFTDLRGFEACVGQAAQLLMS